MESDERLQKKIDVWIKSHGEMGALARIVWSLIKKQWIAILILILVLFIYGSALLIALRKVLNNF